MRADAGLAKAGRWGHRPLHGPLAVKIDFPAVIVKVISIIWQFATADEAALREYRVNLRRL